jgi:hypothetical protein
MDTPVQPKQPSIHCEDRFSGQREQLQRCPFHQLDNSQCVSHILIDTSLDQRAYEQRRIRHSHGIVYILHPDERVLEYGPREELPNIDSSPRYRKLALEDDRDGLWRIACFVVDKQEERNRLEGP